MLAFDPLGQVISYEIQARRWQDDHLIADELHRLDTFSYFHGELVAMLGNAGFSDIEVRDGYDLRLLKPDSTTLLFHAHKPHPTHLGACAPRGRRDDQWEPPLFQGFEYPTPPV